MRNGRSTLFRFERTVNSHALSLRYARSEHNEFGKFCQLSATQGAGGSTDHSSGNYSLDTVTLYANGRSSSYFLIKGGTHSDHEST